MAKIHYAIDIDVSDSSMSWADTSVGLDRWIEAFDPEVPTDHGSHFFLITDSPATTGAPGSKDCIDVSDPETPNPAMRQVWYPGILSKNGIDNTYQRIDIKMAGSYSNNSSFNFSISNSEGFWDRVFNAGIKLIKRPVILYAVLDTGTEYHFVKVWSGVINNNPYDEETFEIQCYDNYKEIHSRIPFPPRMPALLESNLIQKDISLDEDNAGLPYPVTLGKVNRAKAYKILSDEDPVTFNVDTIYGSVTQTLVTAPATAYTITHPTDDNGVKLTNWYITLRTGTKSFTANQLKNYGLIGVFGPDTEKYKIIENDVSTGSTPNFSTKVRIERELSTDITSPDVRWGSTSNQNANVQYYSVSYLSECHVVSANGINSFKSAGNAYVFDEDSFFNVSYFPAHYNANTGASASAYLANFGGTPHANLDINPYKKNDDPAAVTTREYYTPQYVVCISKDAGLGDFVANDSGETPFPNVGDEVPQFRDRDSSTYCQQSIDMDDDSGDSFTFGFEIYPPQELIDKASSYDGVYIVLDQRFNGGTSSENAGDSDLTFWAATALKDGYGRRTEYIPTALADSLFGTEDHRLNQIDVRRFVHSTWVTVNHSPAQANDGSEPFLIPREYYGEVSDSEIEYAFNQSKAKLNLAEIMKKNDFFKAYPLFYLGLRISVDFNDTEARFDYRINEIAIVAESTPKRFEKFDTDSIDPKTVYYTSVTGEYWHGYTEYRADNTVVSNIADAIAYLCMKYENSNTTNATANELDLAEFDLVANPSTGFRKDWNIGLQITESLDDGIYQYISDACKFGFMGMAIDNSGRRYLRAWREQDDPIASFEEGIILRDSLEKIEFTDISELANVFEIKYDKNYANEEYNKTIKIDNISTDSAGKILKVWADGIPDDEYTFAPPQYSFEHQDMLYAGGAGQFKGVDYVTAPPGYPAGNYLQVRVTDIILSAAFTITAGTKISIVDNADDFNFVFKEVLYVETLGGSDYRLYVYADDSGSASSLSTTGTLSINFSETPAWKSQVSGIEDYIKVETGTIAGPVATPVFRFLLGTPGQSYSDTFLITFTSATAFVLSGGGYGAIADGVTGVEYYESTTGLRFLIEPNASYNNTQTIELEVSTVDGWTAAKVLWDACRQSWLTYRLAQKADENLSNCYWFSDLNRYDSSTFDDDHNSYTQDLDNNTAYKYLLNLVQWTSKLKEMVKFSIPITTLDNLESIINLKLLDCVNFTDQKLTNGVTRKSWIVGREVNPAKDTITFELIMDPIDYPTPTITIESLLPDGLYEDIGGDNEYQDFRHIDENSAPRDNSIDENSDDIIDSYIEDDPG